MRVQSLLYIAGLALAALLIATNPAAPAIGSCSFNSVSGVNFGAYDVFNNSHTDSTGSITYTCASLLTPITIDLSKGNASSYATRQMRQGDSFTLNYNLFLDANRTTIWGDSTGGSSRYGPIMPPLLTQVTVTVYGRIPARQNVRVGSYTDTITATINF
jgi:spore coat protein U-like protein